MINLKLGKLPPDADKFNEELEGKCQEIFFLYKAFKVRNICLQFCINVRSWLIALKISLLTKNI